MPRCAPPDRAGLDTLAEILEPMGEGSLWTSSVLWPRALLRGVRWDERLNANGDVDFHPDSDADEYTHGDTNSHPLAHHDAYPDLHVVADFHPLAYTNAEIGRAHV